MKFSAWYELDEAAELAPDEPGVFQVRLTGGLVDYPRGRSAMIRYGAGPSVRAAAAAYAAETEEDAERTGRAVLCRHSLGRVADPAATLAKLLADFRERFGAHPGSGT
jgi:hypothetical protein